MPKLIGSLLESPGLSELIALMNVARQETEIFRARAFMSRLLDLHHPHTVSIRCFSVQVKVRFQRHLDGWHRSIFSSLDHPNIMFEYEDKLYPAREPRVRSYFEEILVPVLLKDEQLTHDYPMPPRRVTLSQLMNVIFFATAEPAQRLFDFDI